MTNKNIIITGASSGIGLQASKDLIAKGYFVSACSRSLSPGLHDVVSKNSNASFFQFDLSNKSSIKNMVLKIFENKDLCQYGLVNCAGVAHGGFFSMTPIEEIEDIFKINYFNQLYLIQLIAKKMIRNKAGSIINIASTAGIFGDEGTIAYGASKAALIHSTKVLSSEYGKFYIRVNAISPAVVETKMSALMDEKAIDKLNSRKSIPGTIQPSDISALIKFLLSEDSKNISGQNYRVDQGMVL
jgi:3-oxoacyl-[acyl-carrier protein] reductase